MTEIVRCVGPLPDHSEPCPTGEVVATVRGRMRCANCYRMNATIRARHRSRKLRGWLDEHTCDRPCPGLPGAEPCLRPLPKWSHFCDVCRVKRRVLTRQKIARRRAAAKARGKDQRREHPLVVTPHTTSEPMPERANPRTPSRRDLSHAEIEAMLAAFHKARRRRG